MNRSPLPGAPGATVSAPAAGPLRSVVLGHPVFHSRTPPAHEAVFEAWGIGGTSRALDVPLERVASVLESLHDAGVLGVNVTAPLKRAAYESCATRSPEALAAGSANCLRRQDGGYLATNTDGGGFIEFLREIGVDPPAERAVILGGGGSAAGIAAALVAAGARVELVVRSLDRARIYAGLAALPGHAWGSASAREAIEAASLVVNTTPVGARAGEPTPLAGATLAPGARAVDLRYARASPAWLAAVAPALAFDGRGLFVAQAARSLSFWFDREPPRDRLRAVADWHPEGIVSPPA